MWPPPSQGMRAGICMYKYQMQFLKSHILPLTGTGAVAFLYSGDDGVHVELVGWKGNKSVRAYVAKNDRIHYLRLLGADTSQYEKNKFQEQRNTELKNSEEKMEESTTEDKTESSMHTSENGGEDLTEEKTESDAPEDSCADDSSISEAQ